MKKFFNKSSILFFIITISLILMQSYHQLEKPRLSTDFISFALSSVAPLFKIGMPYIDYWGINPPGLLISLGLWATFFGTSIQSWHIFYVLLLLFSSLFAWTILRKLFNLFDSLLVFGTFGLLLFSNIVQTQFFPSEINGLFFSLLALFVVLREKINFKQAFIACFLFILAGQMKEVYIFTGFAMFPHLLYFLRKNKIELVKFIFFSLMGITTAIIFMLGYLVIIDSLNEYLNITNYKSQQFNIFDLGRIYSNLHFSIQFPINRFFYYKFEILNLFFANLFLIIFWFNSKIDFIKNNRLTLKVNLKFTKENTISFISFSYIFGSVLGYILQGRYGNKYDIAIIFPIILLISLSVKFFIKTIFLFFSEKFNTKYIKLILTTLLLFLLLIPNKTILKQYYKNLQNYSLVRHYYLFINGENEAFLKMESKINNLTSKDDCITKIYGWGVGDAYYYSRRKSCSKHFLVNLLPKNMYGDYVNVLLKNPPKAIIYTLAGADFNYVEFEAEVFNFTLLLENCYKKDKEHESLYWSIGTKEELSECIKIGVPLIK